VVAVLGDENVGANEWRGKEPAVGDVTVIAGPEPVGVVP
jgi:hypothetical protein